MSYLLTVTTHKLILAYELPQLAVAHLLSVHSDTTEPLSPIENSVAI
jgi:hypothetical protein